MYYLNNYYDYVTKNKKSNKTNLIKNQKQNDQNNDYHLQSLTQKILNEEFIVHQDCYRQSTK
jgi:hypothetical protein